MVRPGIHEIKVSKPGYPPFTAKIKVAAGKTRKVKAALTAVTGRLVVKSKPPMALVTVDDEPVGETPVSIPVPVGPHRVKVALDGYQPQIAPVEVTKGEATPLAVALVKAKGKGEEAATASASEDKPAAGGLEPAPPPGKGGEASSSSDGAWYTKWWLWTGVAAVVVAAVVIPVAVTVGDDGGGGPGSPSLGSHTLHLLQF